MSIAVGDSDSTAGQTARRACSRRTGRTDKFALTGHPKLKRGVTALEADGGLNGLDQWVPYPLQPIGARRLPRRGDIRLQEQFRLMNHQQIK